MTNSTQKFPEFLRDALVQNGIDPEKVVATTRLEVYAFDVQDGNFGFAVHVQKGPVYKGKVQWVKILDGRDGTGED